MACRLPQLPVSTIYHNILGTVSYRPDVATITHTFLYFRKQIWNQARRSISEQPDIHARLMSKYKQVPEWWYAIIFCESRSSSGIRATHRYTVAMFVFGVIVVEVWHTDMPVWAFVVALVRSEL